MAISSQGLAGPYVPAPGTFDEAIAPDGDPRPTDAAPLGALAGADLAVIADGIRMGAERRGVRFGAVDGAGFRIDCVPRTFAAAEWDGLAAGLQQRVRALDRFVADAHGARDCVAAGVVRAAVIDGAERLDARAAELPPPSGRWMGVAGIDVVRGADGVLRVLEDNCRTPSGIAYAMAAREATRGALGDELLDGVRGHEDVPGRLLAVLRGAAPPAAGDEPVVAVLTDGPGNAAFYEHQVLAGGMGVPLLTPAEVEVRGTELWTSRGTPRRLDALYRRTDDDQLDSDVGRLLEGPLRAGTLGLVNAYGCGVADDKLVHAHVEDLIRFYLGEQPLLESVRTIDLTAPGGVEEALDRLEELVVKPRGGYGGIGVTICAHASAAELEAVRRTLLEDPGPWIAQELVQLSTHPTAIDGALVPRHVDLRPFVLLGPDGPEVLPAALTRVAFGEGAMVVNSSRDGGAKDTWMMV